MAAMALTAERRSSYNKLVEVLFVQKLLRMAT